MSCQAQALASGEVVSAMTIERVLHSNPNAAPAPLVTALALIDGGSPSLENQGQGMSVSGNINTGSINLIMDQTNCKDGGMYTCKVATQSSGGQREDTASANLTVEGNDRTYEKMPFLCLDVLRAYLFKLIVPDFLNGHIQN